MNSGIIIQLINNSAGEVELLTSIKITIIIILNFINLFIITLFTYVRSQILTLIIISAKNENYLFILIFLQFQQLINLFSQVPPVTFNVPRLEFHYTFFTFIHFI